MNLLCFSKTLNNLAFHNTQSDVLWTYLLRIEQGHCVSSLRVFAVSVYTNMSLLISWMIWCFPYSFKFTLGHHSLKMLVTAATCAGLNSFFSLFQKCSSNYYRKFRLSTFSVMWRSSGAPKILPSEYLKVQHSCLLPDTCIHTYILTYIHTYIHTYLHTYIHTYILTYILTYIHAYIRTYIYTYIHTNIHTYIHTYIQTYIHTYSYLHTYIHTYILTYLHTYIHTCLYTYILIYIHTYIRVHTYIHTYILTFHTSSSYSHLRRLSICI